eukprot:TRINITY_DN7440_c0_g1_i1.p1 TRINITY_DN7440_c0_g1~~TRINITY_DN7440_c0_g1_i1.p1  ORF type:complete len:484 (-),score=68.33 TRINITY_DN7440_c0_g1_i1:65-1516(-)
MPFLGSRIHLRFHIRMALWSTLLLLACCTRTSGINPQAGSPEFLQLQVRRPTGNEKHSGPSHPFWVFDLPSAQRPEVLTCTLMMLLAGILCSAGGIGGGGIYVTVLMVFGSLSVWDAVPLSKSIVFFGSLSSLALNLRKATMTVGGSSQSLIDVDTCRLVVPGALVGTYCGVFMNGMLPNWAVLCTLSTVLVGICYMVLKTTHEQYCEEEEALVSQQGDSQDGQDSVECESIRRNTEERSPSALKDKMSHVTRADIALAAVMLLLVVAGSVFRHHAVRCQMANEANAQACHHPALFWLGGATLYSWMRSSLISAVIKVFCWAAPLIFCCTVTASVANSLVGKDGWSRSRTMEYSFMSVFTGCLAGFIGIGGGLIFSPFFLLMGMAPAAAVATSSTCVIFTSSSTTFQYLLTDRIIVSLTLLYGIVNLVASYLGTKFVHYLQDHMSSRRSYISAVVSLGVIVSTLLAFKQLFETAVGSRQAMAH